MTTPADIHRQYEDGLEGWAWNERTWGAFLDETPEDACYATVHPTLRGSGEGKRALLWRYREQADPGAFAEEAQTTGDCVSHGDRNARDITRCVEIYRDGEPEAYKARGATEPTYGARGHSGQGMDPAKAARFSRDHGYAIRQDYPGVVDLSKYNARIGMDWGSRGVPEAVLELCAEHKVGRYTVPKDVQDTMDLQYSGYAGHSGQKWGCRPESDSKGMAVQGKSWNHDMATGGFDDTQEFYPETVFFVLNSWGKWNKPPAFWPTEAYGPWIPGMMVVPIDQYAKYFVGTGSIMFYSDIDGFTPQKLPDYLTNAWS